MRKFVKRTIAVGAAVAVVSIAGVAYAAWTASGTGSGYAKATTAAALSTVDVAATASGDLYPGGVADVVLKVHNPNKYPVKLTAINNGSGAITASNAACVITGVTFTNQTGEWNVPKEGDLSITLTGAAAMSNASDDGCQGATFTIPVSLVGASNAS
jgi:hypothetical protein